MILRGTIYDFETKQPIPYASVRIVGPGGNYIGIGSSADAQGQFYLNALDFSYGYYLQVSSVGYQTAQDELYDDYAFDWTGTVFLKRSSVNLPPVVVTSNKKNNYWLLLLALPLLAKDDKGKKVGSVSTGTILTIGAGFLLLKGMGVLNSLLDSLGLGNSGAGAEAQDPASAWNPQYWHTHASAPLHVIFGTSYNWFDEIGDDIYDAFGVMQDDWNRIFAAFQKLKSRSEVSFLAERFHSNHNESLLTFLQNGGGILPWDGLSDAHMKILINYVKSLPTT